MSPKIALYMTIHFKYLMTFQGFKQLKLVGVSVPETAKDGRQ